jgi:ligand-binding sensor domain-containing protein
MVATMTRPRRVVFWVLALVAATTVAAAGGWPDGYRLQTWTTDHGLPQNSVMAVARAADGYVWVGTQEGLVRFDGARFVPYDLVPQSGLRDANVNLLLIDENTVWVAATNAVYRGNNHGFTEVLTEDGRSLQQTSALFLSRSGLLWIGSRDGIHCSDGEVARLHSTGNDRVSGFAEFGDEICTSGAEVSCWDGRRWMARRPFPFGAGVEAFTQVVFDDHGTLWAADASGHLWRSLGLDDLQRVDIPERFTGARVGSMVMDANGTLWLGYLRGGVVRVDDDGTVSDWRPQGDRNALQIKCLQIGTDGDIWLGTIHAGLGRLHRSPSCSRSGPSPGPRTSRTRCGMTPPPRSGTAVRSRSAAPACTPSAGTCCWPQMCSTKASRSGLPGAGRHG